MMLSNANLPRERCAVSPGAAAEKGSPFVAHTKCKRGLMGKVEGEDRDSQRVHLNSQRDRARRHEDWGNLPEIESERPIA